jgi:hypothetical protein
METTSI